MNELIKIEELQVDESKARQIKATFDPMAEMLEGFERQYNDLLAKAKEGITKEVTGKAKRLRLDIAKVRIQTGKLKDEQKKYIKLQDKAIMGVHNILVNAVTEREDILKKIERHFEILEEQRLEKLQIERAERLSQYVDDAHERDLSKFKDDEFEALYQAKKKAHEDAIEAEKKAEAERIAKEKAETEERARIKSENERLKKEAEEREKAGKAERERLAKIEAELRAKKEAEEKAERETEEARQTELLKGDADKVKDLLADLEALKTKYTFKSKANQEMYTEVGQLIGKIQNHITK